MVKRKIKDPTLAGIKTLQRVNPAPRITQEQAMLQEMFGGNPTWGTGEQLPKREGILVSGHGLIKNDDFGETGSMFGVNR